MRQRDQLSQLQSIDAAAITAQVTIPIYSGGINTSRRRQAEHAKTRLAFETRDAELLIDQAVSQRYQGLTEQVDRFAPGFVKRLDRKIPGEVAKPATWDEEGVLDILTEPVQPPSEPRFDPLLDGDKDGKLDEKYRSDDSPVD